MNKLFFFAFISFCFISCSGLKTTQNHAIPQLKLINSIVVPYNQEFKKTVIGGLSGIDFDANNDLYYLISDDRSVYNVARFYTAKIHIADDKLKNIVFQNVVSFKNEKGEYYSNWEKKPASSIDPEDLRYNPKTNTIIWSSEGARVVSDKLSILQNPAITTATLEGDFINNYILPSNLYMQKEEKGPRNNGVLEGITFDTSYHTLYSNLEVPLYDDDSEASTSKGGFIRIYKYDVKSRKNTAQYAYLLDPVAHDPQPENGFSINGISAIQYYDKNKLLIVERSYSAGKPSCTIKVYLCDLTHASDIKNLASLVNQKYILANKKLVLNMDDLGVYIDNVEGITFGPNLSNGKKSLLFVTDNNFSKSQKTQIFLFELE